MSRALVTGADGFIGSHLVEALVRNGHEVRALVCYNSFNSWGWLDFIPDEVARETEIITGDIRDPHGVEAVVANCDLVFHLAALIAIPFSYYSPDTYIDTNVKGTLNVMQAARRHDVEHVIHTSTSEVYGSAQYVPIDEAHPLSGQSPYSASKIGADQVAYSFHTSFGLPVTTIRPFNTYGPRQSARAIVPTVITQLSKGRELNLGSLTPTRDLSFVSDTVGGFVAASLSTAGIGKVTNLGSGFEISIGDLVALIAEVMGTEFTSHLDPNRVRPQKSEVERLWSDNSKAMERFGWAPEYVGLSGLRQGIKETVDWFSNPANLHGYKTHIYNI